MTLPRNYLLKTDPIGNVRRYVQTRYYYGVDGDPVRSTLVQSLITQLTVTSRSRPLPDACDLGLVFVVPSGDEDAGSLAVRMGEGWQIFEPREGWQAFVADENRAFRYYDGAWHDEPMPPTVQPTSDQLAAIQELASTAGVRLDNVEAEIAAGLGTTQATVGKLETELNAVSAAMTSLRDSSASTLATAMQSLAQVSAQAASLQTASEYQARAIGDLQAQIDADRQRLTAAEAVAADLAGQVKTQSDQIESLEEDVALCDAHEDGHDAEEDAANAARLASLQQELAEANTAADALAVRVTSNAADVTVLKAKLDVNGGLLAQAQQALQDLQAAVAAVNGTLQAQGSAIAALQKDDTATAGAVQAIQAADATRDGVIAALRQSLASLQATEASDANAISGLQAAKAATDAAIAAANATASTMAAAIAKLQSDDAASAGAIKAAQDSLTALQVTVAALQATANSQAATITLVQKSAATNTDAIAAAVARIAALEARASTLEMHAAADEAAIAGLQALSPLFQDVDFGTSATKAITFNLAKPPVILPVSTYDSDGRLVTVAPVAGTVTKTGATLRRTRLALVKLAGLVTIDVEADVVTAGVYTVAILPRP